MSVIIYHAEFAFGSGYLLKGGFLGVDVFFVISGFLITSLIMSEKRRTGRFSFVNFYERRARRLLPALLTVMLVSLPFAWIFLIPTQLVDFSKSLVASLLFGSNFYWYETLREYGTESALLKPFLHTWSLAVEEQYYIIFPLILIGIYRWSKNYMMVILTVIFFLSLLFAEWGTVGHSSFAFYMLPSRFWELIAGSLLANILYLYPRSKNDTLVNQVMPLTGLLLILYSVGFVEFDSTHPGFVTLLPVVGTVLIIWFAGKENLVTRVLSSKPFVGVGVISYSLYLWHYPIFAFGRVNDISAPSYDKLGWIVLTFVLSVATYVLIEKPSRRKQIVTLKTLVTTLLAAITIVGAFSFYTIKNDGVKERFPKLIEMYGKNEFDNMVLQKSSWNVLRDLAESQGLGRSWGQEPSVFEMEHLWFSDSPVTKKVLIVGDSHSKDVFNALYLNRDYFPGLEFSRFGMGNLMLPEHVDKLLESKNFLAADIVIISFRYNSDESLQGMPGLVDAVKNRSRQVMLALNTVEFNEMNDRFIFDDYTETHFRDFAAGELKKLFFDNQNHEMDEANESLAEIAVNKDIVLLDKADYICDMKSGTCDGITDEGYKTFYDYGHYTLEGAKYFGRRMYEINWPGID
jgi:peptidoglycan/LPS O-acetylase OafA/YrhL